LKSILGRATLGACLLLAACASEPDRFYTLNTVPEGARVGLASPTVHVILGVNLPALVDRAEMVLSTSNNGIVVLEHQRWAAPLSDQMTQTLARDIENRRADILVGDRGFDQGKTAAVTIRVDIVRLSAAREGGVSMEAHWRIVDASAGIDELGVAVFDGAVDGDGYASIPRAYSHLLGLLADKLAASLRPH